KLDRAGADIANRARRGDRHLAELLAPRLIEPGRRRFLDDLLVTALDRAVALPQMHDIAVRVAEHLHLDMARPLEIALDEQPVVAKGARRLAFGADQGPGELVVAGHDAHAAPATARRGFYEHGKADPIGLGRERCRILRLA